MTVNAGNQFTELFWVPIPTSAPLGFYWIHWQIDQGGVVTEYNEQDNHVHSCMTLNITC